MVGSIPRVLGPQCLLSHPPQVPYLSQLHLLRQSVEIIIAVTYGTILRIK